MNLTSPLRIGIATLIICGCAPLQQAPLLYSSKTTVGVDLSASTTETPGASISLGVKLVDAAYVPVAVSKDSQINSNGDKKPFDIVRIEAVYGEGATGDKLDSLTDENKAKIKGYLEAKRTEDSARQILDQALTSIAAVTKDQEALKVSMSTRQKDKDTALGSASPDPATIDAIKADIDTLAKKVQDDEEQIRLLVVDRDNKERDWKAKKEEAEKLFVAAAQAASLLRTDKRDAMSVYGRFDSKGDGAAGASPSASLAVGKIFSTGVASQNLTEAAKNDALYWGATRCVEGIRALVDKLSDQAKKDELIGKIDGICKSSGTPK